LFKRIGSNTGWNAPNSFEPIASAAKVATQDKVAENNNRHKICETYAILKKATKV
jgi:hypothetical protein